jgi:hypothetical protein
MGQDNASFWPTARHQSDSVLPLGCDAAYLMVVASFVVRGGGQAAYILH